MHTFTVTDISSNGVCGSGNGVPSSITPLNLCAVSGGTPSVLGNGTSQPWTWSCSGVNGGTNASCSAELVGECGSAVGEPPSNNPPLTNLCSSGTVSPSTPTANGSEWRWLCVGTDGNDASCTSSRISPPPVPPCSNGSDDDGDGKTDFPQDPGCTDANDTDETDPPTACSDGIDNDGDEKIDFGNGAGNDPGCSSLSDNNEADPVILPTLKTSRPFVNIDDSVTLTWDTKNDDETLCRLSGGQVSLNPLPGGGDLKTGSVDTVVSARTKYTLTCPSGSATVEVEVEGIRYEI